MGCNSALDRAIISNESSLKSSNSIFLRETTRFSKKQLTEPTNIKIAPFFWMSPMRPSKTYICQLTLPLLRFFRRYAPSFRPFQHVLLTACTSACHGPTSNSADSGRTDRSHKMQAIPEKHYFVRHETVPERSTKSTSLELNNQKKRSRTDRQPDFNRTVRGKSQTRDE